MKNLMIITTLFLTTACSQIDRIAGHKDDASDTIPTTAAPTPTPTPTPVVVTDWDVFGVLPISDPLPIQPSGTMAFTGLLIDLNDNKIQTTQTVNVGYVRRTSDQVWVLLRFGTSFLSSSPYYKPITDGVQVGKTFGSYDAICIYLNN